ncbi:hypothetical protein FQN60_001377 [Etheostoma spectabile]|uniref:Fidgetin n=1 Tax=Etheostoma spectabile TaxID=54343 RepID=A0A5J5D4Y5_9PERO|nr:hypothetical protein FQN60_001377 [Etheostoma spectabile]
MYRITDSVSDRGNGFERNAEASSLAFKPTKQPMSSDQHRKFIIHSGRALTPPSYGSTKSSVGDLRTGEPYNKFGSPIMSERTEEHRQHLSHSLTGPDIGTATSSIHAAEEQLKNSDSNLVELVTTEILQQGPPVDWSDIAGLDMAKATIKEEVLWPILRPDMFSGLATLPRSLLLFGPQGTGRTLLAQSMASQLGAAFLRLSSSALVTKWLGEGDKIIQASFLVARCRQPAVVFIREVDLLLSAQLSEESPVNRLKAELLMQLDSVLTSAEDHVLVVCSTNKPEEIPESLRRYFAKRVLIPLPDGTARHQIISQLLSQHNYCLSDKEMSLLVQRTEGFSGLDVAQLCQEAVVGPLHGIPGTDLSTLHPTQMRPVSYEDFDNPSKGSPLPARLNLGQDFPPSLPIRPGLCNRLQRLSLSLSSFSITPCPCAGHQMTSSPPEELSSFFISAAAWLSPGQQPATQGERTSACLRIRDRLAHYPSVSPSDWTPHVTAPLPPCYSGENAVI